MKRLILLLTLLIPSYLFPATYYVRADGSAANKAAATSSDAANTSMSITTLNGETFSAGDIIYISNKGGNYTTQFTVPSGGSVGDPVYYIGESGYLPTWTSNGIICSKSYVELQSITNNSSTDTNFQFQGYGTTGIVTRNCVAANATNQCLQHLNSCSVTHYNISMSGASDEGLSLHDTCNVIVYGGTIDNCTNSINYVGYGNLTCYDVTVINGSTYSLQPANTKGLYKFHNCKFYELERSGRAIDMSYGYYEFVNCVFDSLTTGDYYMLFRSSLDSCKLINCTFHTQGTGPTSACVFDQEATARYQNNIFSETGAQGMTYGTNGTVTNNCFYNSGTARGSDSQTGNPNFTNVATRDFSLGAGSSCIDTGISLPTWTAVDIDSVSRPQGAAWDIGAYEKRSGSKNLVIVN